MIEIPLSVRKPTFRLRDGYELVCFSDPSHELCHCWFEVPIEEREEGKGIIRWIE